MAPPKSCRLCEAGIQVLNYKDERTLSRFMTDQGKIVPRRISGACARHQRQIGRALKRARYLALVPFAREYEI
ncbi:MAG: 30S ribosomal protein S18 [Gemmatimonadetes bacterium]|nr:30S ribosomal protein S18 [Gemmatimonadota bacterium]